MHIEPGVVVGAKMVLGYATAAGSLGLAAKLAWDSVRKTGVISLTTRSVLTTALVLFYFQVLPHHPVGVSEVHLIMGSTLFLLFGLAPTAIGLTLGLLIQGLFFAPFDLPQYGINVTTLLVPLFGMAALARKVIPAHTAYKDLKYSQALKLSSAFQAGIVGWVIFWALYGQGFGSENIANVMSFAGAYMLVIIVEPIVDLGVLAGAKILNANKSGLFIDRLYNARA